MMDNNDPRLTDFVMGELSDSERVEVENEIAQSPELAAAVEQIRKTVDLLTGAFEAESPLELRDEQKSELANADAKPVQVADRSQTASMGTGVRLMIAATIACLLVGGFVLIWNPGANQEEIASANGDSSKSLIGSNGILEADTKPKEAVESKNQSLALIVSQNQEISPEQVEIHGRETSGKFSKEFTVNESFSPLGRNAEELWGGELAEEEKNARIWNYLRKGEIGNDGKRFDSDESDPLGHDGSIEQSPNAPLLRSEFELAENSKSLGNDEITDFTGDVRGGDGFGGGVGLGGRGMGGLGGGLGGLAAPSRRSKDEGEGFEGLESEDVGGVDLPGDVSAITGTGLAPKPQSDAGVETKVSGSETRADSGKNGRRGSESKNGELEKSKPFAGQRAKDTKKTLEKPRTWKRVKATPNTTRLMVGDHDELDLSGMQVNVQVDGFRARVLVDCFYYNHHRRQLEGNFKLRLPDDASLYYFAFGESAYKFDPKGPLAKQEFIDQPTQFVSLGPGDIKSAREDAWRNVKEARMVPREKAAYAYRETVRRRVDPALVEWSGAGVFNARVFPLAPHKLHRIVIGYDVNLTKTKDGWVYDLDLPEQTGQCQVDLSVQSVAGTEYRVESADDLVKPVLANGTHQRYQVSGSKMDSIRLTARSTKNVMLYHNDESAGDFWSAQFTPELPVENAAGSSRAIFLLDTSLSSRPDKFNVWLKLLESTLDNNRDSLKEFAVLFFDVEGNFWRDRYVANTPENLEKIKSDCQKVALEGATDLYAAIDKVASTQWTSAVVGSDKTVRPDVFLLSDGAANWGETNLRLIEHRLGQSNLGSLFAYQTGLKGTAIANLRFLAGRSGGAVFSVSNESEIKMASTAHRKRPWKLANISVPGATDVLTAGQIQWVYPGQAITVVGRGKVTDDFQVELTQGDVSKTISVASEPVESELASRLYGQVAVGQLEGLSGQVFDIAAAYARHFRITGETCSLLMLESEADYQRFEIKPQEDLFVIKTKAAGDLIADLQRRSADQLASPKAQMQAWLSRLEKMPGMNFKMPTALQLVMDDIEFVAISKPLDCQIAEQDAMPNEYLQMLGKQRLDYDTIAAQADRRGIASIDEAIKVYSSLVERNPGDVVVARDVAFTAMELGRPAPAYHLLRNVAKWRPFEGSVYLALGECLAGLGHADMAVVYYEIALAGNFQNQGLSFKRIVSTQYVSLLRQMVTGKLDSSIKSFAEARLETLKRDLGFETADVLVTMMWNTDQTDVDLHVIEPSGEECYYQNNRTRSGGRITQDITRGFGPEMYLNVVAPAGKYGVEVKYFGSSQNRTGLRNKVHLRIYRGFGTDDEQVVHKTVLLKKVKEKEAVATIGVEK